MWSFLLTKTPLKYLTEGLWRDEAFSYLLAKHSFVDIITFTAQDFNPPLYYFLLHIWMMLFGSSEIAMRSLSLLFYVLGVFCVYEIFKVILKKSHTESFLYILLFICNPLLSYYAFETRMYSMLFCLTMASSYYYFKKDWRNYTLLAVVGLYTHYFMALVIISQLLHTLIPMVKNKNVKLLWWFELKPFIITGLFFLPWALYFVFQNASATSQYWIVPLTLKEIIVLPGLTYSGIEKDFAAGYRSNQYYMHLVSGFSLFFFIVTFAGFFILKKKKKELSLFLYFLMIIAIPLIILLLVMPIKPLYVPRYVIFISASISIVIILALAEMKLLFKTLTVALLLFFSFQFQTIQLKERYRDTTKDIVAKIKPHTGKDDLIYVTTELDYMTTKYYFGDKVYIYGKTYKEIPSYVGKVLIPPSAIATSYPYFPVKAFVLKDTRSFEIHSQFP